MSAILAHKLALYVPSKDRFNEELPADARAALLTHAIFGLAGACGGATTQEARGAWVYQDGTVGTEPVTLVYAYVSEAGFAAAQEVLAGLAQDIGRDGNQDSVLTEVDGCAQLLVSTHERNAV